jgi:putative copper resistance protein D
VFDYAVVLLRWIQMTGAMVLFGSSLFFLYALPHNGPGSAKTLRWPRPLLIASALTLFFACILGLLAQTIVLAGSVNDGLQYDALKAVVTGMSFGTSSVVRFATAVIFLIGFNLISSVRGGWILGVLAGGVTCASFAWMGHGAATPGTVGLVHLASDIFHTLAAGVWIGALVAFFMLLLSAHQQGRAVHEALHKALQGFSGIGSALVALLVATGRCCQSNRNLSPVGAEAPIPLAT